MISSSKAIVLSSENFGEADKYVQFLSQNWGVLTTLAKSARKSRKRYAGGLDIFCHDDICVKGSQKDRGYLVELVVLNSFPSLRDQLERLTVAGKAVQWIRKIVPPGTPVPQIYRLLGQTLALLEQEADLERMELLGLIFKAKLISQLGLHPRLNECSRCHCVIEQTERTLFSPHSGGALCSSCQTKALDSESIWIEPVQRHFLDHVQDVSFKRVSEIQLDQNDRLALNRLVTRFTSYHTHVGLPL